MIASSSRAAPATAWPQLITALIGGVLALLVGPLVMKALGAKKS